MKLSDVDVVVDEEIICCRPSPRACPVTIGQVIVLPILLLLQRRPPAVSILSLSRACPVAATPLDDDSTDSPTIQLLARD